MAGFPKHSCDSNDSNHVDPAVSASCSDVHAVNLQDEHLEGVAPVLGIAAAVGGYTVMELNQDLLTVSITEGLTEDAVTARLHEGARSSSALASTHRAPLAVLCSTAIAQVPLLCSTHVHLTAGHS